MPRKIGLMVILLLMPLSAIAQLNNNNTNYSHIINLGEIFSESNIDEKSIQSFYNELPQGSVVEVPKSILWNGYILNPNPEKHITWIFDDKVAGFWPPPAGDGDITLQYNNGLGISSRYLQNKHFSYPADFFLWNDDPYFLGPWNSNWQQYSSANFRAISGPKSTGNTSAITANLNSYGQSPSGSYDVGLSLNVSKFGQNSTWGLVVDQTDFSGKSPGAFAQWNEYDVWANGADIQSWDPDYGVPQSGHRSVFFVNAHHLSWPDWKPLQSITVTPLKQGELPVPKIIHVHSSDQQDYIWYAVSSGKTGMILPHFPAPSKIVGIVSHGILTVTAMTSGDIKSGDYLTGSVPVSPVQITKQISGKNGGVGMYQIDNNQVQIDTPQPMYCAPRIYDNTVTWQFGEEYALTVSSGIFFTGGDTYDTILAVDKNNTVSNAMLDSTLATLPSTAAVIRMSEGQIIDFSGNGKLGSRNQHTLSYQNHSLNYKVHGKTVFSINDNGETASRNDKQLPIYSRKEIYQISSPKIGMEVFDKTDDTVVVYTKKGWKIFSLSTLPDQ